MQTIAAFDFDGTLTTKDTLWEFLKFSQTKIQLGIGLLLVSPWLAAYFLKLIPNDRAKEKLFSQFFKGWSYNRFHEACTCFSARIDKVLRPSAMHILQSHQVQGYAIYIVSASIENWIIPWAQSKDIQVVATQIETDFSNHLTGKFRSKNCYGAEKVRRLSVLFPNRSDYYIYAYGDSRGDQAMIDYADQGYLIHEIV
ncbi:MAG: HAD-IB family hydrolase [Dysgonamonadaceae bacterium]|nr:HAD-IB family hydrolase [Dysgonamonadaceae bacterium]